MARYLSRVAMRSAAFLENKPSQIAAGCFMLALNALSQKNQILSGSFEYEIADSEMSDPVRHQHP